MIIHKIPTKNNTIAISLFWHYDLNSWVIIREDVENGFTNHFLKISEEITPIQLLEYQITIFPKTCSDFDTKDDLTLCVMNHYDNKKFRSLFPELHNNYILCRKGNSLSFYKFIETLNPITLSIHPDELTAIALYAKNEEDCTNYIESYAVIFDL